MRHGPGAVVLGDLRMAPMDRLAADASHQVDVQFGRGATDHIRPGGAQAEADGPLARVAQQDGVAVAHQPQRGSTALVA